MTYWPDTPVTKAPPPPRKMSMRTPTRIYDPKMDMKGIVLALLEILNDLVWNQSYRVTSGKEYYEKNAERLNVVDI